MVSPRLQPLVLRLQTITDPKDPLWAGLQELMQSNIEIETENVCAPGISDAEAHRGRGRLGMLLDLREQLNDLIAEAHKGSGE